MTNRYTHTSIDRVREADIIKTIGDFVELKRYGSVYKCCSPFTNEKTPSFTVSATKQIFKCFSSHLGGDGIKFVMDHKNVDFIEAVETIAKIHNIYLEKEAVTPEIQRKLDQKAEMYNLVNKFTRSFANAFKKLPDNHWAKELIAERQYNKESLINFQIGYNGNENKLTKWTIENGTLAVSKELGLSKTSNNSSYDFFRNRIMFPIHNEKGTVVAFGGRQSNDTKLDKSYKYINSPESLIYNKSNILYGLFQAKHSINKLGTVILTEGYTDVISMHQNGCDNTVASCGTALTNKHASLLKKYAEEVILLRDGDKAGLKAMLKKDGDIDICLAHGLKVSLCILPDGEDPDTFARTQLDIYTWIQDHKQDALIYKVNQYDVIRDRYEADVSDLKNSIKIQVKTLEADLKDVTNLKDNALEEAKAKNKSILAEVKELKLEGQKELKEIQKIDPYKKALAVTNTAETLFKIKHEVKRTEYVKQIAKLLKISAPALKAEIGKFEVKETEAKAKDTNKVSMQGIKLPDGANKEEFLEGHGFVTVGDCYYFHRINSNTFFQGTTFRIQPLFHIQGKKENKRLCEITNLRGKKKLIDFDSDMLANFNEFRKYLFRIGGFMFLTHNGMRTEHFDKFVFRFEEQFEPALELLTMGYNKKGFYAFANGVFWEGKFRATNKYGIINLEGIDETENEYNQKIDNYYSPAFSVMHQNNQEGDDEYENDRYFIYKESAITLNQWMQQMCTVFSDKAITGILFNFAAVFRDLFLSNYDFFPLLGGFGEKDSGKSAFGKILQNFFYYRLPALDLTQATHVALSRRLSRTTNTTQFCDEYKDKQIRPEVADLLMGVWNGNGREKGKGVGSLKSSIDKINSAVYYAGQFLPTYNENALATRTISQFFIVDKLKGFTAEQKTQFNKLLNWSNSGISSLVVDVMQHRAYFEKSLPIVHAETERNLKELLKNEQYQERIFGNVSMLFTTYSILKDKIQFPFNEEEVKHLCIRLIINNSEQIADSNGLTQFWNIITFLFEKSMIKANQDFVLGKEPTFKILGAGRKETLYSNENRDKILYLRLKSVYQFYNKEASTRDGVDVIGETTIRQYFKSRPYFIGLIKAKRFGKMGSPSCYAFNYTKMVEKGLVILHEDTSADHSSELELETASTPDDLPF